MVGTLNIHRNRLGCLRDLQVSLHYFFQKVYGWLSCMGVLTGSCSGIRTSGVCRYDGILILVEHLGLFLIEVLAWVRCLVLEHLDKAVKPDRQERTEEWSNPVHPVVAIEVMKDNIWAEGTRRVQRTTGKVDTCGALETDTR